MAWKAYTGLGGRDRRKHLEVRRTNFHPMEESGQHGRLMPGQVVALEAGPKRYALQQSYPRAFLASKPSKDPNLELIGVATIPRKIRKSGSRAAEEPFPPSRELTEWDVPEEFRELFRAFATELGGLAQIQAFGPASSFRMPQVKGPVRRIYYYVDRRRD